jgi:hypothetical protein
MSSARREHIVLSDGLVHDLHIEIVDVLLKTKWRGLAPRHGTVESRIPLDRPLSLVLHFLCGHVARVTTT